MKIVLITPLYPPDIAEPAPYVKELARRLSALHSVTVICYGSIPESVDGVTVVSIKKSLPAFVRIGLFTLAVVQNALSADIVYAQAGASVEVPIMLAGYLMRIPLIFRIDNTPAPLKDSGIRYRARSTLHTRATSVLEHIELTKPEINPLDPHPEDVERYESAWESHIEMLESLFTKMHG